MAEAFGRRIGARPTALYAAFQRFAVLRELGRAGESVDELRAAIREFPVVTALRCTLALALAEAGRLVEAEAMLTDLVAGDCRAVPPDALWMSGLAMLAMAAAKLDRSAEAVAVPLRTGPCTAARPPGWAMRRPSLRPVLSFVFGVGATRQHCSRSGVEEGRRRPHAVADSAVVSRGVVIDTAPFRRWGCAGSH